MRLPARVAKPVQSAVEAGLSLLGQNSAFHKSPLSSRRELLLPEKRDIFNDASAAHVCLLLKLNSDPGRELESASSTGSGAPAGQLTAERGNPELMLRERC